MDEGSPDQKQEGGKRIKLSPQAEHARTWMARFFSEEEGRCEKMPNTRGGSQTEYHHLPPWLHRSRCFEIYQEWCKEDEQMLGKSLPQICHF